MQSIHLSYQARSGCCMYSTVYPDCLICPDLNYEPILRTNLLNLHCTHYRFSNYLSVSRIRGIVVDYTEYNHYFCGHIIPLRAQDTSQQIQGTCQPLFSLVCLAYFSWR